MATQFVSAIALAELAYGVSLAEADVSSRSPQLRQQLAKAHDYGVLAITKHTSAAYAELKARLARTYLPKLLKKDRPRWVEEWVDKATGQKLQVDENDLWICAQARERGLVVVTADRGMDRIAQIDDRVRLHIV